MQRNDEVCTTIVYRDKWQTKVDCADSKRQSGLWFAYYADKTRQGKQ